jgi:hypothetical protein
MPRKPADDAVVKELASVVRDVYNGPESDQLTVNYARQLVEKKLKLGEGFLKEGDWKAKSKQIILDTLVSAGGNCRLSARYSLTAYVPGRA